MKAASFYNIRASVVADSIAETSQIRLTTMLMTYPRFVHAEHMRHRAFSFCVASSRALPSKKFARLVRQSPARPVWWGKNEPGMQANAELTGMRLRLAQITWELAKQSNLAFHFVFRVLGLHKQIANRVLEAWMPVTVLVSGTDWKNFFFLRSHPAAQPEMCAASDAALASYVQSAPVPKISGDWHLPFMDAYGPSDGTPIDVLKKVSAARCARTSYMNHLGKIDILEDCRLHDRLATSGHWSPFEHVATPMIYPGGSSGNFRGWQQYRKEFLTENAENSNLDLMALLLARQKAGSLFAY